MVGAPSGERLSAALEGHTIGKAPCNMPRASFRAPPLRLPDRRSHPATWVDGKRAAHRSPVLSSTLTPTYRRRSPDSGVDMATQKFGMRRLGSAVMTRLLVALEAFEARDSQQRRRDALTEHHRLHFDLLCKAMDDPSLAAVVDTYDDDVTPERQRQFIFANAWYINALYFHRIGALSRAELFGHLRVMCQSEIFREYWAATGHHRASLPSSSEEAELGRMMDTLIRDQDEADTDEWWVVGQPPTD